MSSDKFERYEIIRELGRGGMATVYQARDPRFERDVALKTLPREFMHDPTFRTRFEREAKAIAALEHAAIVPVHDYGEAEGQPYLVMRYMSGGSLASRIRQGPLSLKDAARIARRIGSALDSAHKRGIIHRDIKPANILFDRDGEAYLSDFGIVKMTEATAQLTGSGIVGTPAYMAPEMSEPGGVTSLIDVYALGVTLFQAFTGKLPYEADTPLGLMMAHASQEIPDMRSLRPDLPEGVQYVISRALAKDPMERYQTATDLAADLETVASGKSIAPFTAGAPRAARTEAVAPVAPSQTYATSVAPHTAAPSTPHPPIQSPGLRPYPQYTTPPPRPQASPSRKAPVWAWIIGGLAALGILIVLIGGGIAVASIALRPTPTPTATPTPTNTPTPTPPPVTEFTQLYTLKGHSEGVYSTAFSADSSMLASASADGTAIVWSTSSWNPIATLRNHSDEVRAVAFSPDGRYLATGSFDGTVILWSTSTWQPQQTLRGYEGDGNVLAFTPDSSILVSGFTDYALATWDVSSGTRLNTFGGHSGGIRSLALSPDGSLIASGSNDDTIIIWDTYSGGSLRTLQGHADNVRGLAFTPDGSLLISSSTDNTIKVWSTSSWSPIDTLTGHTDNVTAIAASPDGRSLASGSADFTVKLWDISSGSLIKTLSGHTYWLRGIAWSPDGRYVASAGWDEVVIIWGVP